MGLLDLKCASESPGELVILEIVGPHFMIPRDAAAVAAGLGNQ